MQRQVVRFDLLKDLADYLMKLKNQFNLDSWIELVEAPENADEYYEPTYIEDKKIRDKLTKGSLTFKKLKECGTTGCAMGHAPSVPSLAKAGLKLSVTGNYIQPNYKGNTGLEAAEALFHIPQTISEALFLPGFYHADDRRNPKAVAERIYELLGDPFNFDGSDNREEYDD